MWITLLCILGALGYAQADCYPGDTAFTAIVQEVYHGVTSDSINFEAFSSDQPSGSITRQHLCSILTNHHNNGRNPGQLQTNRDYLRYVTVSESKCIQALTYPQGYDNINGWIQWRGSHSGYWYSKMGQFTDNAVWFYPYYKQGAKHLYVVQPVRFDSQYRIDHCKHRDSTGATCRDGWNQSGQGVRTFINMSMIPRINVSKTVYVYSLHSNFFELTAHMLNKLELLQFKLFLLLNS